MASNRSIEYNLQSTCASLFELLWCCLGKLQWYSVVKNWAAPKKSRESNSQSSCVDTFYYLAWLVKLPLLSDRRRKNLGIAVFRCLAGFSPQDLQNYFILVSNNHVHKTRGSLNGIHTLPLNFLFCDWFFSKYAEWIENVHCTPRLSAYSLFVISWPLNRHNKSREIPKWQALYF